jgi:hypothetical protein
MEKYFLDSKKWTTVQKYAHDNGVIPQDWMLVNVWYKDEMIMETSYLPKWSNSTTPKKEYINQSDVISWMRDKKISELIE